MEIEPTDQKPDSQQRMAFDEVPVGRKSNQSMFAQEHPPGYVETAPVQEELPLEKRLVSKVWKFRQGALQELIQECQKSDENVARFEEQMIGWLADSNVNCQEKAFRLLDSYLSKRLKLTMSIKELLKVIVEKGFTSNKPDIVRCANNVVVQLLDKGYKPEIYIALMDGLSHKNPKVPVACVDACGLLLMNYGPKRLDMLKIILKELQQHCETTSTLLRSSLINFYKQAFKWIGEGMIQFMKLKKPTSDEFEKFAKSYQRIPMVPLRASQQEAANIESGKAATDVDPYTIADPVDVINRYDDSWVDKTLEIAKWSEKKDVLDTAIADMSTPKIVPREHYHLVGMLKKLMVDSNIAIQICGMKMAKALASGLRKAFNQGGKVMAPLLIAKLRDKKNQITDEAHKALKALFYSITLEDMIEPIKDGLIDKAPNMRLQTLKFLQTSMTKKDGKAVRLLMESLLKLTSDGAAEVRQKVIEVITEVKNTFGSGFIGDRFKDVQSQKLQKILSEKNQISVENIESQPQAIPQRSISVEPKGNQPQKKIGVKTSTLHQPQQSIPSRSLDPVCNQDSNNSMGQSNSRQLESNRMNVFQEPNIASTNESVKLQAYQSLVSKPIPNVLAFLRNKGVRESHHNVLRAILTIYERAGQELTKADLEYLVLHDWRKSKNFLSDYLASARVGQDCGQVIRQNQLLKEILGSRDSNRPKVPLVPELHSYLPKMMHPQMQSKLSAADSMLHVLQQYKPTGEDFAGYTKEVTEMCNVIKCRINDPEPQISKKYITLTRLLTKVGIVNKTRGRILLQTIVSRLNDPQVYLDVRDYMNDNLMLYPGHLFSHLHTMLANEFTRIHLLLFIEENISQFIKTADLKAYLPVLFHLLSIAGETAAKAQCLLNYIVQSQGEGFLEKSIRQLRIDAPETYLAKWGLEKRTLQQMVEPNRPALTRLVSKMERLRDEPLNPWPLIASPSHIYQLVAMLHQLPYPFCEMGTLLPVTPQLIQKLVESPVLPDYSDIVMKWLFWRFQIQRKEVVLDLIGLAKKMIANIELEEMELIILLAGLLGVVKLGPDVLKAIDELHRQFKPAQQQKILRFWVNFIKDNSEGANEILQVLMLCFHGGLPSELLVELAAHHSVRSNTAFIKYLLQHYDRKNLQVYGFDLDESALKARSSMKVNRRDQNHRPNNRLLEMVENFKSKESADVLAEIGRIIYPKSQEEKAEFYVELWEALYNPILQSEIKPGNIIAYNVHVAKQLGQLPLEPVLARMARILIDLLMEVDERKPQGHTDIIKSVNNTMLKLLEIGPNHLMVEVMLAMIRQELSKTTEYCKIVGVLCKCLSKLVKNQQFSARIEWFIAEVFRLFDDFYFNFTGQETPNHKVMRQTVAEAINNSREQQRHREVLRQYLQKHSANEFTRKVFQQIANGKPKETAEDTLMSRLNLIKSKCGVEDIRLGPNIWQKKNLE